MYLYTAWNRNMSSFKSRVIEGYRKEQKHCNSKKIDVKNQNIFVTLSIDEKQKINSMKLNFKDGRQNL